MIFKAIAVKPHRHTVGIKKHRIGAGLHDFFAQHKAVFKFVRRFNEADFKRKLRACFFNTAQAAFEFSAIKQVLAAGLSKRFNHVENPAGAVDLQSVRTAALRTVYIDKFHGQPLSASGNVVKNIFSYFVQHHNVIGHTRPLVENPVSSCRRVDAPEQRPIVVLHKFARKHVEQAAVGAAGVIFEQNSDKVLALEPQIARRHVGRILILLGKFKHQLALVGSNVRVTAQNSAHSTYRKPGKFSKLFKSDHKAYPYLKNYLLKIAQKKQKSNSLTVRPAVGTAAKFL